MVVIARTALVPEGVGIAIGSVDDMPVLFPLSTYRHTMDASCSNRQEFEMKTPCSSTDLPMTHRTEGQPVLLVGHGNPVQPIVSKKGEI